jgi:hypothetical protein
LGRYAFRCACGALLPGLSEWYRHVLEAHPGWLPEWASGERDPPLWRLYRELKGSGRVRMVKVE